MMMEVNLRGVVVLLLMVETRFREGQTESSHG